jgi:hypothetical protein
LMAVLLSSFPPTSTPKGTETEEDCCIVGAYDVKADGTYSLSGRRSRYCGSLGYFRRAPEDEVEGTSSWS